MFTALHGSSTMTPAGPGANTPKEASGIMGKRVRQLRRRTPAPSSEAARRRMESARQRDTAPEIALRSSLHRMGLRFRVDARPIAELTRRADVLFRPARVAVFVDGCFWHGCPIHGTWPKANAGFWKAKIQENRRRDQDTDRQLAEEGWLSIRVWEHEDPDKATARIHEIVQERRGR